MAVLAEEPTADPMEDRVAELEKLVREKNHTVGKLRREKGELQRKCQQMHDKVHQQEMEIFRLNSQLKAQATPTGADTFNRVLQDAKRDLVDNSAIDLSSIMRNVKLLNQMAEQEQEQVIVGCGAQEGGMRKLVAPDSVVLTFYNNGVTVTDTNPGGVDTIWGAEISGDPQRRFVGYTTQQGKYLLTDLVQGFLPAELQNKYPKGITLKVVDATDQAFTHSKQSTTTDTGTDTTNTAAQHPPGRMVGGTSEGPPALAGGAAAALRAQKRKQSSSTSTSTSPSLPAHTTVHTTPSPLTGPVPDVNNAAPKGTKAEARSELLTHVNCDGTMECKQARLKVRGPQGEGMVVVQSCHTVDVLWDIIVSEWGWFVDNHDFEVCNQQHAPLQLNSTFSTAKLVPTGVLYVQKNRQ
eukprot:TRINITY_DN47463_c0_g1_i1.p1 TRINITY_DN47463_c0_g1~~TRINITY_DN47463_c0_g1_i1.p1  ORF type:complete len:440 (+),score=58.99 TRINITY_DN47463_c0_g1_i1:96-1322(+)